MPYKQTRIVALSLTFSICKFAATQTLKMRDVPKSQSEMHQRVSALYNFHPSQLTDEQRKLKSEEMDAFWEGVKGNVAVALPMLRVELRTAPNGSFFLTDGSELLASLSKSPEDEQLAADSLARTDLRDTQPTAYFYAVHSLASDNADTTQAALHMLDEPGFHAIIAAHAMTLDLGECLMYVTMSMKDDRWVKPAEARFAIEKGDEGKLALVFAFFYGQTDEADTALRRIAVDSLQPEAVRKKAQEFVADENKASKSWFPANGTVTGLREERRQRLRAVSDEAMDDVQNMTEKLVALRAKGKH